MSGDQQTILVTGAAGFIGGHLCKALLEQNYKVIGLDCMIPYYDLRLKEQHLSEIASHPAAKQSFHLHKFNINDRKQTEHLIATHKPVAIVHLAAQAGVRYCEANPEEAEYNNTQATRLLLDLIQAPGCSVKQFLFASSSSIYGEHQRPWNETLEPRPVGVYGTSKFRGEQMCKEVSEKHPELSIAALRFFTVYGPLGRPDMSPAKFLERVFRRQPLPIYGDGSAIRDFTFVGDIVDGIVLTLKTPPKGFELYNLGKGTLVPNSVMDLIRQLEKLLHKPAILEFEGPQAGDVPATQADITKAQTQIGYKPRYELAEGLEITVRHFHRIVPKHLVVILRLCDDSELLCHQLEILNSQSRRPDLVLLLDQSNPVEFQQNEELLKNTPGWEQFPVSQRDSNVWRIGVDHVQQHVRKKRFGHASEVFVQFGLGHQTWPADLLSSLESQIAENGFEAIHFEAPGVNGGAKRDDLLVRLDVLEEIWETASLNESKDDAFLPSVQEALRYADNVYKNF